MSQHSALLPAQLSYYDVSIVERASDTTVQGTGGLCHGLEIKRETLEIKNVIERLSLVHRKM